MVWLKRRINKKKLFASINLFYNIESIGSKYDVHPSEAIQKTKRWRKNPYMHFT